MSVKKAGYSVTTEGLKMSVRKTKDSVKEELQDILPDHNGPNSNIRLEVDGIQQFVTFVAAVSEVGPIVQTCSVLVREIIDLVERAEHNTKTCRRLKDHIVVANQTLERKVRGVQIGNDSYLALQKYKDALVESKSFIIKISDTNWFLKLISAKEIEWKFADLTQNLNTAIAQLGLEQIVRTRQDMEEDSKIFREESKATYATIEAAMKNIFDRGEIRKMRYIARDVAQKEIGDIAALNEKPETIERQVAILTELKDCEYIIRFHGTMQRDGRLYIISEWAEVGDLNNYLKNNPGLPWSFKIRIASEVANGLNLVAKLSNFSSSRKEADASLNSNHFKDLANQYKWLAPEKLRGHKVPYTKQCDIYSFSIVLWELASQETPFQEYTTINKLIDAVVSGTRPPLIEGTPTSFEKMMQKGWKDKPIKRPTAWTMFKELNNLNKQVNSMRHLRGSSFDRQSFSFSSEATEIPPEDEDSRQIRIDLLQIGSQTAKKFQQTDIDPRTVDVSYAKKLHQQKEYAQAWPIFKSFAEQGDPIAEFYVGYYLIAGDRGVPQNKELAVEYFRRSAEKGIADAQFRYGVALLCGEGVEKNSNNDRIAIENLRKSAQNGNRNAMYNYGDLLINGAHGLPENLDEGIVWMRRAHDKGHPQAYRKLAARLNFLKKPIPDDISKWLSTHNR
ncbi:1401_t:CDS:2 [Ambispora leptoticha]|uniref:1401_t:CDS:1 n=1 Tax=Ambispora leptoticha TaxID=144679 RepID=A0A9N8Z5K3_9GLOM|nr:1401_t:CDS:2 [Ambispora leptoticha]